MPVPLFEQSVFINCPFDPKYQRLLHAIVFTTVSLGLVPRCALETGEADLRFQHILDLLQKSKYSIHDLSRFAGEGEANLARMNMPLELGVAIGLKLCRKRHRLVVMVQNVPEAKRKAADYEYHRFISDLSGNDPLRHQSTPQSVTREVYSWLTTLDEIVNPQPSGEAIFAAFPAFQKNLANHKKAALRKLIWNDVLKAAAESCPKIR